MAKNTTKYSIIILLAALLITPFTPVLAESVFNPNFILSDKDLIDKGAFSLADIQAFLSSKGGKISEYKMVSDGSIKTAAQIIWITCQKYNINPQLIMALLQKEQGLITSTNPSSDRFDWAAGAGVCDSCDKNDPELIAKYKGFDKQVEWAAKLFRSYMDDLESRGYTVSGWGPGITRSSRDGIIITPVNKATAALYTYNPWVGKYGGGSPLWGANSLLWKTWTSWFIQNYPDGSLLQAYNEDGVWYIQDGQKRPITSKATLVSRFDPKKIIFVTSTDLDNYEMGTPIKFPNYSLLQGPTGAIYLLVDDQKRGIVSQEVFRKIGFNPEEIVSVAEEDLANYKDGAPITMESVYPTGALLQNNKTGGVYFVQDGTKYPIWSKEILLNRFSNKRIIPVSPEELDSYSTGYPVKFKDGELVTAPSTSAVYVISNGQKRPIASAEVFNKMGYSWDNIIKTSDKALEAHATGQPIQILSEEPSIAMIQ